MVILESPGRDMTRYFCGSASGYDWSSDRDAAARYPTDKAAWADARDGPAVWAHVVARARTTRVY